ncbi:MAG: ATP-binding cassette domain-containing protein [Turneriella sp.]|nr:ATP-binding cassette domain-containing protein [Leptospiraceae bacterium]MCX7631999.1 ATP-binding cassette domain-containing protein [Turneriella sp.]
MPSETQIPAIELCGIRKVLAGQVVHDGLDLKVARGKTTVVVGASGAGKSVMLKYILGFMQPDSGDVRIDGQSILGLRETAMKKIRSRYGVVFQGAALFDSMTVFENVAFPLVEKTKLSAKEIEDRVMHYLSLMRIAEARDKLPAELSGGMQRRVALARALQLDPEIVLFDEPTTGLDPETSESIYDLFIETQQRLGYTALIVSHDIPRIFRVGDEIAVLHNGKIESVVKAKDARRKATGWLRRMLVA